MKTLSMMMGMLLLLPVHAARINDPHIPETAPARISEHVYEIESWPDVGFVVGSQAILVVDTGLGPRNGAIVAKHAAQLARNRKLYLVTTHFHPEHASGEAGFPAGTVLIRSRTQQEELAGNGARTEAAFRQRPGFDEFLPETVPHAEPGILFDSEYTLDLGGVHARIMLVGPAHTKGDQIIWVEEDRTLLSGDLAIHDEVPARMAEGVTAAGWIAVLDRLAALHPLHVVPDHGEPGDASLITTQRELLNKQITAGH